MFERETKREKLIEAKNREHKTKMQTKVPYKVDNSNANVELAIEEIERELAEVVDRMVSYCDLTFFQKPVVRNTNLRTYRINVLV